MTTTTETLTREAILAMPAGPELDALVAERVMGWEVLDVGYFGSEDETPRMRELEPWMDKVGIEAVGRYAIDVARDFWRPLGNGFSEWQPSLDIKAVWEVLERVRTTARSHAILNDARRIRHNAGYPDMTFELQIESEKGPGRDVFVAFEIPGGLNAVMAWGETAPLAICRAALLTTL